MEMTHNSTLKVWEENSAKNTCMHERERERERERGGSLGYRNDNERGFSGGPVVKTSLSNTGGARLIPGWGAKISHASWPKNRKIKQKQYCTKFNKDFQNGPHQK